MPELSCRTIEIIRGSTHDGPGVRTTVFLKGCSLRCSWCQNPEGIAPGQEVWWTARNCIGCGACVEACPNGALAAAADGLVRDRASCTACGACVEACPAEAMTFTGRDWTLDQLLKEACKDRDYYRAFGGGVTVSGGEPLCQHRFVAELLQRLRDEGIHTALDTCGLVSAEALASVLPHTSHVLFDIKLLDPALHKAHTGQTNEAILANLLLVADHIRQAGTETTKLWIRTPLIPGATAAVENIAAIAGFLQEHLPDVVERWELCAFNGACKTKYERLGRPWPHADQPLLEAGTVEALRDAALSGGIPPRTLVVSGLVAKDKP